jgi:hypothetical protein
MRKLKSRSSEAKKKRRNQVVIGIILIIVMFGSVFGVIVGSFGKSDNSKTEYNGFEFIQQGNFWVLPIGDFNFVFRYNPNEIQEIDTEVNYLNSYSQKPLYISSENTEATYEIASNLETVVLRMQNACLNGSMDCEETLPIKTCEDNFIIIKENNFTNIIQEDNCVFIQGPSENLTMVSDEFLFHILGVR